MVCPKCGSSFCQLISETETEGKDYSVSKGCCGYIIFGWIGLLCGLCTDGKKTKTRHFWVCSNCGKRFKE